MKIERDMVAVVTGGASGIGEAMAADFAQRGLHLALVDIDGDKLEATRAKLAGGTSRIFTVCTDLSQDSSIEQLRSEVNRALGIPDLVCANAGIYANGGPLWLTQSADWQWAWQVNVMGVVRTLQALVPGMLLRPSHAHVVITASIMGFTGGATSVYSTSKHAVARVAEGLHHDLTAAGAPIGVTLLCPGPVATHLMEADRNRPAHLRGTGEEPEARDYRAAAHQYFQTHGLSPGLVAAAAVEAIERNQFFAFPGATAVPHLESRLADIRMNRSPTLLPLTAHSRGR